MKMTSIPLYLSNSGSSVNRMKFLGEMLSFYTKQQSWMSHVHALTQIHARCVLSQLFEALEGEMDLRRKRSEDDISGWQSIFPLFFIEKKKIYPHEY